MTYLRIEKMDAGLADAYTTLSGTAFDDPAQRDPKHIVWKHVATPNGPSTAYHLYDGDTLVGRTLSQPRTLKINGGRLNGAFMIDLYIHPDYRGGLNFMKVMEAVEADPTFDFICHSSNETSDMLFREMLKRPHPIKLAAFGVPLRISRLQISAPLKQFVSLFQPLIRCALRVRAAAVTRNASFVLRDETPSSAEFDRVRTEFEAAAGAQFERSLEFLDWRFKASPCWDGSVRHLFSGDRYRGYIAFSHAEIMGGRFCILSDAMIDPDLTTHERTQLRYAVLNEAMNNNLDAVYGMLNLDNPISQTLLGFPFVKIPEDFLPHPVPLFVYARREVAAPLETETSTYVTLGDLDYF